MKAAVSSKLVLSVTCDSCTQEQMVDAAYEWKMFKVNTTTNDSKVEILDTSIFEAKGRLKKKQDDETALSRVVKTSG